MAHRIGGETRRGVAVAVAALDRAGGDMRRRGHSGRGRAVVATDAVRVRRLVDVLPSRPAGECGDGTRMARGAVLAARRNVTCIRRRAVCTFRSLAGVGAIVTGVAATAADRRMRHRVGREAGRRVGVAVAALDRAGGDVRRRHHTGRCGAVVAAGAVGVCGLVDVSAARPTGEAGRRARMTGDAVATTRRDVAGVGHSPLRTLGALARI